MGDRQACASEGAREFRGARGGSLLLGRGTGSLRARGAREGCRGRRGARLEAALSRACGRAAANANQKPELAFETQNHARTDDCVLEAHQKAVLDACPTSSLRLGRQQAADKGEYRAAKRSFFCVPQGWRDSWIASTAPPSLGDSCVTALRRQRCLIAPLQIAIFWRRRDRIRTSQRHRQP